MVAFYSTSIGYAYATQYLSIEEAQKVVFPQATAFEVAHVVFTDSQIKRIESQSGETVRAKGQQIWKAKKDNELLGYFVVDYVIGKHLVIDYVVGLQPDKSIKSVEILQYRETYGGEVRNPDWLHQFVGKTKDSKLSLNDDIINIGGATLSSRNITDGVKRVLATVDVAFDMTVNANES